MFGLVGVWWWLLRVGWVILFFAHENGLMWLYFGFQLIYRANDTPYH